MRMFSYKIARDYGFAPNPFHGTCSLATCKPHIRKSAAIGDLILGCGSAENNRIGHLIFAMRVTSKASFQEYWNEPRHFIKRPNFRSSIAHAYGDNIYHQDSSGAWFQERSHHSFADGTLNGDNLKRDTTTSKMVLLSTDFVYFGRNSTPIPAHLRNFNGDDAYPNVRDYRSRFDDRLIAAVDRWFSALPRGVQGHPINWN